MKAMILSAGYGTRMRHLTKHLPKPLLKVGRSTLIEHHLEVLSACGIDDVVINLGYLGHLIRDYLGDGARYGVKISYSVENPDNLLDSGGGVKHALQLLGDQPFLLLSADVWTDFSLRSLISKSRSRVVDLLMVENPTYHRDGDFSIAHDRRVWLASGTNPMTYAGIGVFCPSYFSEVSAQKFGLYSVIEQAIRDGMCFASVIQDARYVNVGTPELLAQLNTSICEI